MSRRRNLAFTALLAAFAAGCNTSHTLDGGGARLDGGPPPVLDAGPSDTDRPLNTLSAAESRALCEETAAGFVTVTPTQFCTFVAMTSPDEMSCLASVDACVMSPPPIEIDCATASTDFTMCDPSVTVGDLRGCLDITLRMMTESSCALIGTPGAPDPTVPPPGCEAIDCAM